MPCGKPTDDGSPCDRPAGWGTDDASGPCADHRDGAVSGQNGRSGRQRTGEKATDGTGGADGTLAAEDRPWGELQIRRILDALRDGATYADAARAAGVGPRTFRRWRRNHEDLRRRVERAEAEAATEAVRLVRKAAENGDWRAGSWFLENRHGYGDDPDPEQFVEVVRDTIREELDGPTARKLMAAIGDRLEELDR